MNRGTFYLALFATCFALVVVVFGANARLVDAGLGCPDWPGCYGQITVPETAEEITRAEALFPDAPVEIDKGWAEMIHRYVAGVLGLVILGIAVRAIVLRRNNELTHPLRLPLAILVLVVFQALFGMWTVTLKLWPQVVTIHLLGGFATVSLLFLLALRCQGARMGVTAGLLAHWQRLYLPALLAVVIVVLQITLGGWTSSNYAAYACSELPTCQGSWWPPMDFAAGFDFMQSVGPNYLGGLMDNEARVAIHMTHRIGALVTTVYIGWLVWFVWRLVGHDGLRKVAILVLVALVVQVALGLSNVIWHLPLPVAVAHNAGGALLLLTLVALNYYLRTVKVRGEDLG